MRHLVGTMERRVSRTVSCAKSAFHRWVPGDLNGHRVLTCTRCGMIADLDEARAEFERLQTEARGVPA